MSSPPLFDKSQNLDTTNSDFGDLPVKVYRLFTRSSDSPHSWAIGSLANLQGPEDNVYFNELWSHHAHPDHHRELSKTYGQILANQSTKWRLRFKWRTNKRSVLHIGNFDREKGTIDGLLVDMGDLHFDEPKSYEDKRMSTLGLIAGGIAHDFNNLLCAILSFARLAQSELDDKPPVWHDINEVIKAAEAAEALTRQILTFARVKDTPEETVDLNRRLSAMSSILIRLLGESIHLSLKTSPLPARVCIDPVQFDQVVLNLALNARDAMTPEGGRLIVKLEPDETGTREAVLTIQDTGKGMTPETLERIFEPFFTTKQQGQGTGLGLANCRAIIDRSGGHIEVQSSPGIGTTFTLSWPLSSDPGDDP